MDVIYLTKELVKFKTYNNSEIKNCLDFIKEYLLTEDMFYKRFEFNGVCNDFYSSKDFSPEFLFCSHIDVIKGEDEQFTPKVEGDFLIGRGAGDMKASVAAFILLFKKYFKTKNIGLLITGDEEVGGFNGAGRICNELRPEFVMVGEPTNLELIYKQKGKLGIKLTSLSEGGHGARPWESQNPILELVNALTILSVEFPIPEKEEWSTTFNIGSLISNVDYENKTLGLENIIPSRAIAVLDFRFTEEFSKESLLEKITFVLKELNVGIEEFRDMNILFNKKNYFIEDFSSFINKKPTFSSAASDGRFFSNKGIQTIVYGPKSLGHHGPEEKVQISSVKKFYEVLDNFLNTRLCPK